MEKKCAEKYSIDWNRIEGPAFGKTKQKGHTLYDMYAHVFIMKIRIDGSFHISTREK